MNYKDYPIFPEMWRPARITEYACLKVNVTTIEEFMVDPTEIVREWFNNFIFVDHYRRNSLINPKESLTQGFVPKQDTLLPIQFQAVTPTKSTTLANKLFRNEASGKIHGWYFTELPL